MKPVTYLLITFGLLFLLAGCAKVPRVEANAKAQGAYLTYGKGRVMVFGEAAMFSAQLSGNNRVGFNHKRAKNNAAFLFEVMHWLTPATNR